MRGGHLAALALGAGFALGCASGAQPGGMKPDLASRFSQDEPRTVSIQAEGGDATFPLGRSKISNRAFTEALAEALRESGLMIALVDHSADYHLFVRIEDLQQPHWAFPMTVRLTTSWRLWSRGRREPIWRETLSKTYTEPFEEEFFGIKRLRLATEGAARQTIEQAVVRVAESVR